MMIHYILLRKIFKYQVYVPSPQIITHFSINEPEFLCNIWHKFDSGCVITEDENLSSVLE